MSIGNLLPWSARKYKAKVDGFLAEFRKQRDTFRDAIALDTNELARHNNEVIREIGRL